MKSEKTNNQIDEFWRWFSGIAGKFAGDDTDSILLGELDHRVQALAPELSWEVGPGLLNPWQLVISPELDPDLREKAKAIVSRAPVLKGWEFHSARQPKEWDYILELNTQERTVRLDTSSWTFVLLKYPDHSHEVLLKGNNVAFLDGDERVKAALIVLESLVGEDALLDKIDEFELVDQLEPRFASKERPIQELRGAVLEY